MTPEDDTGTVGLLGTAAALGAAATAGIFLLFSLRWPLEHDLPIFLYAGFLIHEFGAVPYGDFFEINAPGTMFIARWMHVLTDGDSSALRILDACWLGALWACTLQLLRPHGWQAGVLAASLFTLAYLAGGHVLALQREYVCMLPLALSLILADDMQGNRRRAWARMAGIGVLSAFAVSIKPALGLCWIPVGFLALANRFEARPPLGHAAKEGAGLAVPLLAGVLATWGLLFASLGVEGAAAYLEIFSEYYPLYGQLDGNGAIWEASSATAYLERYVGRTLDGPQRFRFLAAAFIGVVSAWSLVARRERRQVLALTGLALAAALYVPTTGKFWLYHHFPFFYAASLFAGIGASRLVLRSHRQRVWQGAALCAAVLIGLPTKPLIQEFWRWRNDATYPAKNGRVDLITNFLVEQTDPSDTVTAFDTTSGAFHGLYQARRPMHGTYIYDFHFYHQIDHPYVKKMRAQVLDDLSGDEPDYVVWMDNTWSRRPNFPELDELLARDFEVALAENDVTIYRRRRESP